MVTIHASHIEKPEKEFYVKFLHAPYFNVYFHVAKCVTVKVLAETPDGALKIAQYHYFDSSNFTLVDAPKEISIY
jgi:hypothetical protein